MTDLFRCALTVALIASLAAPAAAGTNQEPNSPAHLVVNVRIFNYADVPSAEFAKAWKETRRIFRRAGVDTTWTDCAIPGENAASNPRCIAKTKASDIVIRIIPAVENFKNHNEFGVALIPSGRGFGKYASIFYDRVEGYVERWRTSEGLLLGHLIAHEMGHLLLGAGSQVVS